MASGYLVYQIKLFTNFNEISVSNDRKSYRMSNVYTNMYTYRSTTYIYFRLGILIFVQSGDKRAQKIIT